MRPDADNLHSTKGESETSSMSNSKLEQDYIRMYLGDLTPMQVKDNFYLVSLKTSNSQLLSNLGISSCSTEKLNV